MTGPDGHEQLARMVDEVLGPPPAGRPAIVGVGGGVAVGKSTTAEALAARLVDGTDRTAEVVGTDGFLLANAVLEERGLAARKGFPESYDQVGFVAFLGDLRAGRDDVRVPLYSHATYDRVEGPGRPLGRPDLVVVEGLNVLGPTTPFDRFDVTVYVDAEEEVVEGWFVARLLGLWAAALDDETSFYRPMTSLSEGEVVDFAHAVWATINGPNLRENVLPGRDRADIVVEKGPDHALRRLHGPRA